MRGAYSIDDVNGLIERLEPLLESTEAADLDVDLSGLTEVSPAPLATLIACLLDAARRSHIGLGSTYVPPDDPELAGYLDRSGLGRLVLDGVPADGRVRDLAEQSADRSPPCWVFTKRDQIFDVSYALRNTLVETCGLAPDAADGVAYALNEVTQNVVQHARSESGGVGVAPAQRSGDGMFEVAIADMGVGIRDSLAGNPDYADCSDHEALRAALERGVTGSSLGGGDGLFWTWKLLVEGGGTLLVRSGTAGIEAGEHNRTHADLACLPGTLVVLRARVDRSLALDSLKPML